MNTTEDKRGPVSAAASAGPAPDEAGVGARAPRAVSLPVRWSPEELRQAVENFAAFLSILWEWELRQETEAVSQLDVSLGQLGGKDGKEVK